MFFVVEAGDFFFAPAAGIDVFISVVVLAGEGVGEGGVEGERGQFADEGRGEDFIAVEGQNPVV